MSKQVVLEEQASEFIIGDKDGISINWRGLASFKAMNGYEGKRVTEEVMTNLFDFLKEVGFLVPYGTKCSYAVVGNELSGSNIGPDCSSPNFARLTDARAYSQEVRVLVGREVLPTRIMRVIE